MAITHSPLRDRATLSPQTITRLRRTVTVLLTGAVTTGAISLAILLGDRIWHVLIETGLAILAVVLIALVIRHAVAIFRDEP